MLEKIFKKIRRKKVIRGMLKGYLHRLEIELLMEDWITQRILEGRTDRREELINKQKELTELKLFIEYLKQL